MPSSLGPQRSVGSARKLCDPTDSGYGIALEILCWFQLEKCFGCREMSDVPRPFFWPFGAASGCISQGLSERTWNRRVREALSLTDGLQTERGTLESSSGL